ncbi:MAG: hypothetical protein VYD87_21020 [Pseudomonadota bacterium]|nr:hypothetical protein [Pseudomonadota bacterium]
MSRGPVLAMLLLAVPGFAAAGPISLRQTPPPIPVAEPEPLAPEAPAAFPTLVADPLRATVRLDQLATPDRAPSALREVLAEDPVRRALVAATAADDPLTAAPGAATRVAPRASSGPDVEALIAQLVVNAPAALLRTLRAGRIDPIATGAAAQATETGLNARLPADLTALGPIPATPAQRAKAEESAGGVDSRAALIGLGVLLALALGLAALLRRPERGPRLRDYRERQRVISPAARPPGQRLRSAASGPVPRAATQAGAAAETEPAPAPSTAPASTPLSGPSLSGAAG